MALVPHETNIEAPTDPDLTYRGFGLNRNGVPLGYEPPYPSGSFAKYVDTRASVGKRGPFPFDVGLLLRALTNVSLIPNPDGITRIDDLTIQAGLLQTPTRAYPAGVGAIQILRVILDASGLPYVVKSGYRKRLVDRPNSFEYLGNQVYNFPLTSSYPATHNGFDHYEFVTDEYVIASSDDGHPIGADSHEAFNALDIAGPNGTRAELNALLDYLRRFPELFEAVKIGADYKSSYRGTRLATPTGPGPYSTGERNYYSWGSVAHHYATGKRARGTLVISAGKRLEWSPYPYRYAPAIYTGTPAKGLTQYVSPDGFGNQEGVELNHVHAPGECYQSDRIHIETTRGRLRDGLTGYELEIHPPPVKRVPRKGNTLSSPPVNGLAYPPILTTDLPVTTGASGTLGLEGKNYTMGVVRIPNGFKEKEFAGGLCVMFRLKRGATTYETRDFFNFGFHRPGTSLSSYSRGWTVLDAPDAGPVENGVVAAQRRGEWVYGVSSQQGGQFRYQYVDRMNSINIRERRQHDAAIYYEGLGSAAAGATTDSFAMDANSDMFVSDHEEPELYYLSGFGVGKTTDRNGLPMAYHWMAEDQRGFGNGDDSSPFYPTHRFKYEFWQTWQDYSETGPANTQLPSLVWDWDKGDYDPPDLWFYVPEKTQSSTYTGRIKIYRSSYKKNQWSMDRGYVRLGPRWVDYKTGTSDPRATPAGQVGKLIPGRANLFDDEKRNPDKYAYEADWYNDAHYVGTVGPFRGAIWGPNRDSSNGSNRVFRVIRDVRRKGHLTLVMFQRGSVFGATGTWDGAWFASTRDNGKTWNRARQMNPFVEPRTDWSPDSYEMIPSLAMLNGGELLANAQASFKGNEVQALVNINYVGGAGIDQMDRRPVIFRQGSGGN